MNFVGHAEWEADFLLKNLYSHGRTRFEAIAYSSGWCDVWCCVMTVVKILPAEDAVCMAVLFGRFTGVDNLLGLLLLLFCSLL